MKRFAFISLLGIGAVLLALLPARAGVETPHLISFQAHAVDSLGQPISSGDVVVRIYDAASGGNLVYDSGTDFTGVIEDGIFNVLLGSITPLELDNTLLYYLEVDVNGQEVVGDAAGGRQSFYPGGGSHERQDLEDRITLLESIVFLECDPGCYDLNGDPSDTCEFCLDPDGIYVSAETGTNDFGCGGGPTGTCGGCYPCQTILYGIQRAQALGKSTVYVADGLYDESVSLVDGISLKGGYREGTWERHVGTTLTVIRGSTGTGHRKTLVAQNIGSPTVVEGFVIYGEDNYEVGGNSYAMWLRNCSAALTISSNEILAGDGGHATATGTEGSSGSFGTNGSPGVDAKNTSHNCYEQCVGSSENPGGSGGAKTCGGSDYSGGAGGTAMCPDYDESTSLCTECGSETQYPSDGNGQDAPNEGGFGGEGGYDALLDYGCKGDCNCYVALSGPKDGGDGTDGSDGYHGSGGLGGFNVNATVVSDEWIGSPGSPGDDGTHGKGGGGGGGGGGVETYTDPMCSADGGCDVGGSGGGGGSGGCGAGGGGGGAAGGGSFGIFVSFIAPPGVDIPTISGNTISRGRGGNGAGGGDGGAGGPGGSGASGGAGGVGGSACWCAGAGGKGGDGGDGGDGGGGGGGCGGMSYSIYSYGHGGADLSAWKSGNTFKPGGAGGTGGPGGGSPSGLENGTDGETGTSGDCNF